MLFNAIFPTIGFITNLRYKICATFMKLQQVWLEPIFICVYTYIWRKCTFSPYILTFFHFNLYILFLPLLVPKSINICYFRHFRELIDGNNWGGSQKN